MLSLPMPLGWPRSCRGISGPEGPVGTATVELIHGWMPLRTSKTRPSHTHVCSSQLLTLCGITQGPNHRAHGSERREPECTQAQRLVQQTQEIESTSSSGRYTKCPLWHTCVCAF